MNLKYLGQQIQASTLVTLPTRLHLKASRSALLTESQRLKGINWLSLGLVRVSFLDCAVFFSDCAVFDS